MAFVVEYDNVDGNSTSVNLTARQITNFSERSFMLHVFPVNGDRVENVEVILETSLNGIDWMPSRHAVRGKGYLKEDYLCAHIRPKIRTAEGITSNLKIVLAGV